MTDETKFFDEAHIASLWPEMPVSASCPNGHGPMNMIPKEFKAVCPVCAKTLYYRNPQDAAKLKAVLK